MKRKSLKQRRKELGVKVADIAISVGISLSFYYKIEAGTRNPTIEQAKKVADFLNDTVDNLFFGQCLDKLSNKQHLKKSA